MIPSPKELDAQSRVKIDKWIDLDSEECRELDENYKETKRWYRLLSVEPAYLQTDSDGRIWGRSEKEGVWFPFHFDRYGKNYGYRLSKRAAN